MTASFPPPTLSAFTVSIDYPLLLLALILLWFPRQWLRFGRGVTRRWRWGKRGKSQRRETSNVREPGDTRLRANEEFAKPRNYIDLFRALLGALLLVGNNSWGVDASLTVATDQELLGHEAAIIDWLRMGVLLVAVMIQFIRYEGRVTLYAPIFFLGGLGLALCGFNAGMIALLVAWTMNASLPLTPASYLTVYGLLLFVLGLLFRGMTDSYVLFVGTLCLMPVVVSLLTRRTLVVFTKRIK